MVEHQTDRMVMVGFAVLMFGILAVIFRKGIQEIMELVVKKITSLINSATKKAATAGDIKDPSASTSTSTSTSGT